MRNATMLYKAPGSEPIHGAFLATLIIDADEEGELEAAIEDGWFLTTPEAIRAYEEIKAAEETKLGAEQFANDGTDVSNKPKKAVRTASVGIEAPTVAWGSTSASAA